jgi:hypothetical protein
MATGWLALAAACGDDDGTSSNASGSGGGITTCPAEVAPDDTKCQPGLECDWPDPDCPTDEIHGECLDSGFFLKSKPDDSTCDGGGGAGGSDGGGGTGG